MDMGPWEVDQTLSNTMPNSGQEVQDKPPPLTVTPKKQKAKSTKPVKKKKPAPETSGMGTRKPSFQEYKTIKAEVKGIAHPLPNLG